MKNESHNFHRHIEQVQHKKKKKKLSILNISFLSNQVHNILTEKITQKQKTK
jgi:hypothetical protein